MNSVDPEIIQLVWKNWLSMKECEHFQRKFKVWDTYISVNWLKKTNGFYKIKGNKIRQLNYIWYLQHIYVFLTRRLYPVSKENNFCIQMVLPCKTMLVIVLKYILNFFHFSYTFPHISHIFLIYPYSWHSSPQYSLATCNGC